MLRLFQKRKGVVDRNFCLQRQVQAAWRLDVGVELRADSWVDMRPDPMRALNQVKGTYRPRGMKEVIRAFFMIVDDVT
jgi:hypothetical protein